MDTIAGHFLSQMCYLSSQVSRMSIDFDSAALQTQQEEEEEYDQEDYAREQEVSVQILNTALISQKYTNTPTTLTSVICSENTSDALHSVYRSIKD